MFINEKYAHYINKASNVVINWKQNHIMYMLQKHYTATHSNKAKSTKKFHKYLQNFLKT